MGASFHAGFGGEVSHTFKGLDELGPAIRVAGVVESVDTDKNVVRFQDFGPGERDSKKHRISRWNVRDRNVARHIGFGSPFGNGDVVGERGVAELAEVNGHDNVFDGAERTRDLGSSVEFNTMALAVIEGEGVALESVALRNGEGGSGVETSAEETDGFHE